eukprot:1738281-Pyramimonas_sp.AAC.1
MSSSQVPWLDFSRVLEQASQLSSLMAMGARIVPGVGAAGVGEARSVLEKAVPPPMYPSAASPLSSPRPASDPARA